MGVVVRRYIVNLIIITYPYSTYISFFFAAVSLLLCSFKKCFIVLRSNDKYSFSSEEGENKKKN